MDSDDKRNQELGKIAEAAELVRRQGFSIDTIGLRHRLIESGIPDWQVDSAMQVYDKRRPAGRELDDAKRILLDLDYTPEEAETAIKIYEQTELTAIIQDQKTRSMIRYDYQIRQVNLAIDDEKNKHYEPKSEKVAIDATTLTGALTGAGLVIDAVSRSSWLEAILGISILGASSAGLCKSVEITDSIANRTERKRKFEKEKSERLEKLRENWRWLAERLLQYDYSYNVGDIVITNGGAANDRYSIARIQEIGYNPQQVKLSFSRPEEKVLNPDKILCALVEQAELTADQIRDVEFMTPVVCREGEIGLRTPIIYDDGDIDFGMPSAQTIGDINGFGFLGSKSIRGFALYPNVECYGICQTYDFEDFNNGKMRVFSLMPKMTARQYSLL